MSSQAQVSMLAPVEKEDDIPIITLEDLVCHHKDEAPNCPPLNVLLSHCAASGDDRRACERLVRRCLGYPVTANAPPHEVREELLRVVLKELRETPDKEFGTADASRPLGPPVLRTSEACRALLDVQKQARACHMAARHSGDNDFADATSATRWRYRAKHLERLATCLECEARASLPVSQYDVTLTTVAAAARPADSGTDSSEAAPPLPHVVLAPPSAKPRRSRPSSTDRLNLQAFASNGQNDGTHVTVELDPADKRGGSSKLHSEPYDVESGNERRRAGITQDGMMAAFDDRSSPCGRLKNKIACPMHWNQTGSDTAPDAGVAMPPEDEVALPLAKQKRVLRIPSLAELRRLNLKRLSLQRKSSDSAVPAPTAASTLALPAGGQKYVQSMRDYAVRPGSRLRGGAEDSDGAELTDTEAAAAAWERDLAGAPGVPLSVEEADLYVRRACRLYEILLFVLVSIWQRRACEPGVAEINEASQRAPPFPTDIRGRLLLRGGVSGWLLDEMSARIAVSPLAQALAVLSISLEGCMQADGSCDGTCAPPALLLLACDALSHTYRAIRAEELGGVSGDASAPPTSLAEPACPLPSAGAERGGELSGSRDGAGRRGAGELGTSNSFRLGQERAAAAYFRGSESAEPGTVWLSENVDERMEKEKARISVDDLEHETFAGCLRALWGYTTARLPELIAEHEPRYGRTGLWSGAGSSGQYDMMAGAERHEEASSVCTERVVQLFALSHRLAPAKRHEQRPGSPCTPHDFESCTWGGESPDRTARDVRKANQFVWQREACPRSLQAAACSALRAAATLQCEQEMRAALQTSADTSCDRKQPHHGKRGEGQHRAWLELVRLRRLRGRLKRSLPAHVELLSHLTGGAVGVLCVWAETLCTAVIEPMRDLCARLPVEEATAETLNLCLEHRRVDAMFASAHLALPHSATLAWTMGAAPSTPAAELAHLVAAAIDPAARTAARTEPVTAISADALIFLPHTGGQWRRAAWRGSVSAPGSPWHEGQVAALADRGWYSPYVFHWLGVCCADLGQWLDAALRAADIVSSLATVVPRLFNASFILIRSLRLMGVHLCGEAITASQLISDLVNRLAIRLETEAPEGGDRPGFFGDRRPGARDGADSDAHMHELLQRLQVDFTSGEQSSPQHDPLHALAGVLPPHTSHAVEGLAHVAHSNTPGGQRGDVGHDEDHGDRDSGGLHEADSALRIHCVAANQAIDARERLDSLVSSIEDALSPEPGQRSIACGYFDATFVALRRASEARFTHLAAALLAPLRIYLCSISTVSPRSRLAAAAPAAVAPAANTPSAALLALLSVLEPALQRLRRWLAPNASHRLLQRVWAGFISECGANLQLSLFVPSPLGASYASAAIELLLELPAHFHLGGQGPSAEWMHRHAAPLVLTLRLTELSTPSLLSKVARLPFGPSRTALIVALALRMDDPFAASLVNREAETLEQAAGYGFENQRAAPISNHSGPEAAPSWLMASLKGCERELRQWLESGPKEGRERDDP